MNKLEKRLKNYNEKQLAELYQKLMTVEQGSEWEQLMNCLYSGIKESLKTVYKSDLFKYYSEVFQGTAYLDEMKRLLDELDENNSKILTKIDKHFIQSINLIVFILEEDLELDEDLELEIT